MSYSWNIVLNEAPNFVERRKGEVRRTPLPRTPVNRGRKRTVGTSASVLVLVASRTSETASFRERRTKAGRHSGLRRVHRGVLQATQLGDTDRASAGVGGT